MSHLRLKFAGLMVLFPIVNGFGKYLDLHSKKQKERDINGKVQSEAGARAIISSDMKSLFLEQDNDRNDKEIDATGEIRQFEAILAILIASIFVSFFLVYLVALKCWWRYSEQVKYNDNQPQMANNRSGDSPVEDGERCWTCLEQNDWEMVELNADFKQDRWQQTLQSSETTGKTRYSLVLDSSNLIMVMNLNVKVVLCNCCGKSYKVPSDFSPKLIDKSESNFLSKTVGKLKDKIVASFKKF